jgi:hypothetical protein
MPHGLRDEGSNSKARGQEEIVSSALDQQETID